MTSAALLAELPRWAFALMLVLARVGATVMLLPGFGETEIPPMVRAGLTLALALLLLPALLPTLPAEPATPVALLGLLAGELLIGAWLGWLARLAVFAFGMAGQIVAYMMGLSSVLAPDPALGGQSTALERLFSLTGVLLVLGTGLYALPLRALAGTYTVLAPGKLIAADDGLSLIATAVADSFALALRLAAPFVLVGTIWQIALGFLARLVPRLQVYFIAMPGQILGGFLLLGLLSAALLAAWHDAVEQAFTRLPGHP